MNREEITRMAREAGIGWGEGIGGMPDFLERFAKLVAAAEREALSAQQAEPVSALERYNETAADPEIYIGNPFERLRIFCSVAMSEQDWLDAEPFFDAVEPFCDAMEPAAELVADAVLAEREACAQLCEDEAEKWEGEDGPICAEARMCAAAIRIRRDSNDN